MAFVYLITFHLCMEEWWGDEIKNCHVTYGRLQQRMEMNWGSREAKNRNLKASAVWLTCCLSASFTSLIWTRSHEIKCHISAYALRLTDTGKISWVDRMCVWGGQPFIYPCLFSFYAQLSHSWINGFDLCQTPGGFPPQSCRYRCSGLSWQDSSFFLFLPTDWFPNLASPNGLNIARASNRLNLATAAKPNRPPVRLLKKKTNLG